MAGKYIEVTFVIEKDGDQYSALCKELGTVSCGDTVEEATANIKEAVVLYLNTIEELGQRTRIFRERGISLKARPTHPSKVKDLTLPSFSAFVTRNAIPLGA